MSNEYCITWLKYLKTVKLPNISFERQQAVIKEAIDSIQLVNNVSAVCLRYLDDEMAPEDFVEDVMKLMVKKG